MTSASAVTRPGMVALCLALAAPPAVARDAIDPARPLRAAHAPHAAMPRKAMRPATSGSAEATSAAPRPKTIPMDFSGMNRSVQDVTTPSHAHGNVGFPGQGGGGLTPGIVPSTTTQF